MPKIITDKNKIKELLTRGVVDVIVKKSLEKKLMSGKQLRIKHGVDPTGPKIHLGRASTLRKLAKFQELGHKVVLIIGDFTALIGDASDKDEERTMLTRAQVKENMKGYLKQMGNIFNIEKAEIHYNSEWLSKLNYYDICRQANAFSAAQILDRDNFSKRFKAGERISLREMFYPLMQGYDSVAIKSDIEIGGSDQLFNVLAGRELQRLYKQEPQDIITFKLMDGIDGRKMSTSWGNVICVVEDPKDIYGKIMSMRDEIIAQYFELATDIFLSEIKKYEQEMKANKINPRDLKMKLAREIVRIYHGDKKAKQAEEHFIKTVQKKEAPDEVRSKKLEVRSMNIINLLMEVKLVGSKGEARRLIAQNGIKVDGKIVEDANREIKISKKEMLLQRGKRQFVKVIGN
ncbi:tyrosine--tRNA ligase [Patescibacteria group bacterium]|nr:tyrosine--tRNA ligase [Patescibacteria group bacterium]MBU4015250.1 tyrosine--tRNA ligase [Patescibacteria group bacterium]MBU4026468.1 tyrosine--tRNA ligase [Patescibacteria group bacterium]MBU4072611.1 tyrosine--tRNA ligase [Patescibacteria group bacterium]MBU4103240.1 tyrosine--tRNA ligase [Patescibacteria group bacterium]